MNKYIEEAFKDYGFEFGKYSGYGHIEGYEVNVLTTLPFSITFSTFLSQTKKNEFILKVNNLRMPMLQAHCFDYGVGIAIKMRYSFKNLKARLSEILPEVLKILEELEAPKSDICPQSGEPLNDENSKSLIAMQVQGVYGLLGVKIRLSNSAIETVNNSIDKSNEDFKNAPNNYAKGFVGILAGALVGGAITFLLGMLGYITFIAPVVSIFLGVFLYKKFGGKPNAMMIVMSFVTTLVIISGALFLGYMVMASNACAEIGRSERGIEALKLLNDFNPELQRSITIDLVLNALFVIGAEGFSIAQLVRMVRRPKNLA